MEYSVEEIGKRMDALGVWERLYGCHWAIKPRGSAFPYFCAVLPGEIPLVRARVLLLDGWQTFHSFLHARVDPNFGFYSSPMEMPHFELVILADGKMKLFRHDPCYMPQEANAEQKAFCAKMFWEIYGVMMRVESDPKTPMMYASEQAVFSRVEGKNGKWSDQPLELLQPRPHVEKISFPKEDIAKAKDRPFAADSVLSVDFRIHLGVMTREARPRVCYCLIGVDPKTGSREIFAQVSPNPEGGLKALWEAMPAQFLRRLIERGTIPGEIRVCSQRVFRMFRPLVVELPFKLSMNLSLPEIEAQFR